jgi:ribosomal protein S18 acetylase RimI-like enzyme
VVLSFGTEADLIAVPPQVYCGRMTDPVPIHRLGDARRGSAADGRATPSDRLGSYSLTAATPAIDAAFDVAPCKRMTADGETTPVSVPRLQPFTRANTRGVVDLLAAEGWDSYTEDPQRTARALSAPGCTTLLALDGAKVVALVQVQSDGEIQAHLSALLVAKSWRGRGLGRQLLREALRRAGGSHVDVLSRNPGFYEALGGRRRPGFRLTADQLRPKEAR